MRSQLIAVTIGANNPETLTNFYSQLLGVEFGRALSDGVQAYHNWVSSGVKFNINSRQAPTETVIPHFTVDNLGTAIAQAPTIGGVVVFGPAPLTIAPSMLPRFSSNYESFNIGPAGSVTGTIGTLAIVRDPEGNRVGLVELESWALPLFQTGVVTQLELAEQLRAIESGEIFEAGLA